MAASLLSMLIPTLAGIVIFQDIARRSELTERSYAVRDLGLHIGTAAQAVDQFGNLAQRSLDFFRTGRHFTIQHWDGAVNSLDSALKALQRNSHGEHHSVLQTMQRDLIEYQRLFLEVIPLLQERGIQDFGVAGSMRAAVHELEESTSRPDFVIHLLTLRRREKDYIIRDLDRYLDDHRARATEFRRDLRACVDCPGAAVQKQLLLLDSYTAAFERLVDLDRAIGLRSGTGLYGELQRVEERLFDGHRILSQQVSEAAARMVSRASDRMIGIVGAVAVLALLVSGLVARLLTRPLAILSEKIKQYVKGNFSEPISLRDFGSSTLEVSRLASDFSYMQEAIRSHLHDLSEQRQALVSLNAELQSERSNLSLAQRMAGLGHWRYEAVSGNFSAAPELLELLGHDPAQGFDFHSFVETVIAESSRDEFLHDTTLVQQSGRPVERVYRACSATGEQLWIRQFLRHEVESDNNEQTGLVGVVQDVSGQRRSEDEIRRLAYFDSLTGLSQRTYLYQRLEEMLGAARRRGEHFAVLFLDLDKFKEINDSLGHEAGDALLVTVADRLRAAARESDFAARLGGDEFCVLLDNINSEIDVAEIVQRLLEKLAAPVEISGRTVRPAASVGVAIYPLDGGDVETIMRAADNAMYTAKRLGEHGYVFHRHDMSAEAQERLRMSRDIRRAFREDEFTLHYQPQVSLATGRIEGWEALLRWQHPQRGMLAAGVFIADLERIGLVTELGRWVIDRCCRQLAEWRNIGLPQTRVAINIAPRHMAGGNLPSELSEAMVRHGVTAGELEIEITEAGLQSDEAVSEAAEALRSLGIGLAIDDFGTGYSSLASLRSLRLDSLKIDRTFVQFSTSRAIDRRLLHSIIELGKAFGHRLVAEGVETREQMSLLEGLGCDLVQGFLFSRAVPPEEVPELFLRQFPNNELSRKLRA